MAMKWVKGRTKIVFYPKAASTAFSKNSLVYFDGSGAIIPADATSGDHIGLILKAVAATDADYASNTLVPVEVPQDKVCEFEADVTSGLTAAKVGTTMDLTDASTVSISTSKNVVTCVKYLSATKGRFVLNSTFDVLRVATT